MLLYYFFDKVAGDLDYLSIFDRPGSCRINIGRHKDLPPEYLTGLVYRQSPLSFTQPDMNIACSEDIKKEGLLSFLENN